MYEIPTWPWLHSLGEKHGRRVLLGDVPDEEWDAVAGWGIDAVWLMGVWERSPEGRRIAIEEQGLEEDYRLALPGFTPRDVAGSPYCVHRYRVDELLGGPGGLAVARAALAARGIRLILDFVPNHTSPDHPWVFDCPACFIREGSRPANGGDPYSRPWPDTAQLNVFHPDTRQKAAQTLEFIAEHCDGVRCDMAMLVLNEVFKKTWGDRAGTPPRAEYWTEVSGPVRRRHPDFLWIAESYWDLERRLFELGFDFCYDKRLYDRLAHDDARSVRDHLSADPAWQRGVMRFLENHDEPRAAVTFPGNKQRAAATVLMTVPGAKLFFHGQFSGWRVKLPVQLGRAPQESSDHRLACFYGALMAAARELPYEDGKWELCECWGWEDNASWRNLLAWSWERGEARWIVAVNYSDVPAQGRLRWPWTTCPTLCTLRDQLSDQIYVRDPGELRLQGLFVALPAWGAHLFQLT